MVGLHLFRSEPYFLASLPQEPIRDRCQGHGAVRTLIYPYAVPAVLSVCQNQRTPKVMHKSWSLTRHVNDVFQLCTDLTDLYSHAFAPENLSCISLSIVHRHRHMPEPTHQHSPTNRPNDKSRPINQIARPSTDHSCRQNQVSTNHGKDTGEERQNLPFLTRFINFLEKFLESLDETKTSEFVRKSSIK